MKKQLPTIVLSPPSTTTEKHVVSCALEMLVVIWLFCYVVSAVANKVSTSLSFLYDATFTPFLFVLATLIWVVLSRVINPSTRLALFIIWCLSLLVSVFWATASSRLGDVMQYACLCIFVSFAVLLVMSYTIRFSSWLHSIKVYELLVGALMFAMLYFSNQHLSVKFVVVAVVSWAFIIFQIATMYSYSVNNANSSNVSNNCIFAVMAPWTDTVESFSAIARALA